MVYLSGQVNSSTENGGTLNHIGFRQHTLNSQAARPSARSAAKAAQEP